VISDEQEDCFYLSLVTCHSSLLSYAIHNENQGALWRL
jgi:hypothetical protein